MTFGILPVWLGWAVLLGGAALALAAFLLKARPTRRVVSSLVIWQRVLDGPRERSFWERLRWLVSLAATLAIALALAVGFTQPRVSIGATASGRTLIVLDSSWTMAARRSDGSTRWDQAAREATALVRAAAYGEVAIATTAEGVVEGPTNDLASLVRAIDRLQPTGAADAAWPHVVGATAVHLITDGATGRAVDDAVVVHSVFQPAPNIAVSAFDVDASAGSARVFAAVTNHARVSQDVSFAITRGPAVVSSRSVQLGAGATHREEFVLPLAGDPKFSIEATAGMNALDVDDEGAAWLWEASPLAVTVVGLDSEVPALLAEDPTLRVSRVSPDGYPMATADVWVFDRWLPAAAPSRPALVINPPETSWLGATSPAGNALEWRSSAHPLLEGVDGSLVRINGVRRLANAKLRAVSATESGAPIVTAEDGPVRRVVLGFALSDSNLAMSPAFPVLMGNAIDWLGRPDRARRRALGPVVLPSETARLVGPTGQAVPLTAGSGGKVATLVRPGLYLAQSTGAPRVYALALGHPERSNLFVSWTQTDAASRSIATSASSSWWQVALSLGVLLLAVEWVTWQRRVTV